jgi:crossover junction endodeoxyribonuclease RuvC
VKILAKTKKPCNNEAMKILGIDPGLGRMGWGVIGIQRNNIEAKNYGCIETDNHLPVEQRLADIYYKLQAILNNEKPDAIALEELFFNTNAKTAFIVGQARGVVLLLAAQHNLSVGIYTPLQVKIALTGYGRAGKSQIGQMVKILLHLNKIPKPDDTTDALAIALTHAFTLDIKRR